MSDQQDDGQSMMLEVLERLDVRARGHFELKSGVHAEDYFDKDQIGSSTRDLREIAGRAVVEMSKAGIRVGVVLSPAAGAVAFGTMLADELGGWYGVYPLFIYVEKDGGDFRIRPNMRRHITGKLVAIAEDVFTSGGSVKKVMAEVEKAGGRVVCVVGMIDRGGVTAESLGVDHFFVAYDATGEKPRTWEPAQCLVDGPCSRGEPLSEILGQTAKRR